KAPTCTDSTISLSEPNSSLGNNSTEIRPSDSSSNTFLNSFAASPRMESSTVLKPTLHSYDSSLESSPDASSLFEQADITNRMNRMKRKKLFIRKILTLYPLLIGVL